jgi:bla regulator protein blaR1
MKTFLNSIPESVISSFGWTLVHSVWQGTLLALIALAAFCIFRRSTALLRYNLGIAILSMQVIASAATFLYYQLMRGSVLTGNIQPVELVTQNLQKLNYNLSMTAKLHLWLILHLNELVICWIIGASLLMLRFAGGWLYAERLRSYSKLVMDKQWRARFGILVAKLNITKSVEFRETTQVLTPMVIGALRPVVLIPVGLLTGFSTSQIEAILAHELAHIRRNDYLVNMIQSFVEVVFFFHPALWWISGRVRTEREHCCDDIALSVCEDKLSLAHALIKVAEFQTNPQLVMAFASKKPLLLRRIKRVLGVTSKTERYRSGWTFTTILMSFLIGFSMYAVGQKKDKKLPKKTNQRIERKVNAKARTEVTNVFAAVAETVEPFVGNITEPFAGVRIGQVFGLATIENDSIGLKMLAHQKKMDALQAEMEPLQRRMEEVNLRTEQENFEMERYNREMEKLEWKKNKLMEGRSQLMEKRSALFQRDGKTGQTKLSDSELEKQLGDLEQQIKAQEQQIIEFNAQIADARKQAEAYKQSDSYKNTRKEISEINEKIEVVQSKIEAESREIEKIYPAPPPPPVQPRAARNSTRMRVGQVVSPKPAKTAAPASKASTPPPPPPVPATNE